MLLKFSVTFLISHFLSGKFITAFKNSKIVPIFKKDNHRDVRNYRPISLLLTFSKLLEKVVLIKLSSFLKCQNIRYPDQFEFRKNHSTSHATTLLISKIADAFEKKESVLGISLNLSKAFDTIDHNMLIYKLNHYGVRVTPLSWFKSYLTGCTQKVKVSGSLSSTVTYSVPQSSKLDPSLIIIYVYDFKQCLHYSTSVLFAVDTNTFVTGDNVNSIYSKAN